MKLRIMPALVAVGLLTALACNRGPAKEINPDTDLDRVSQGPKLPPQRVTHGLTKLDKNQKLAFEVPPHQLTPKLTGSFSSFVQGAGGARISDDSANVELMVMTEDQYEAYTQHRSAESLYAIDPSHDHGVSISLPATQETGAHYFAVFRRDAEGKAPIWVNADLSVVFESTP
jgi:hypothetical protein